jgi:hypothetical protein
MPPEVPFNYLRKIKYEINTVNNPPFFNNSGKKGLKVVKSGKIMAIFAKTFQNTLP